MPEQREFRLDQNLENLVKGAINARSLKEASQEDVSLDLRREAMNLYSILRDHTNVDVDQLRVAAPWVVEQMLDAGETELYGALNHRISDDVSREANGFYLSKLDEDHKADFYVGMLEKGMVSEAPSDNAPASEKEAYAALVSAKKELGLAKLIENAVRKGKLDLARALVSRGLNVGTVSLVGLYHGLQAKDAEGDVYRKIANIRREVAKAIIKDKKLYGLIDKGIERNNLGKAYSLVELYQAYNQQVEDSRRR